MATLQTVFDYVEVINRDLNLQTSEKDVVKGIVAFNMTKDHLDALLAQHPGLLGDVVGTVTTSASTETTTFPSGVLRIDRLRFIDASTSLPTYTLDPDYEDGSANSYYPPIFASSTSATGRPVGYSTDGTNIRWIPLPDGTHTIRYYGYASKADLTGAGDTVPYPDIARPYLATFMSLLMTLGTDDATQDYQSLAFQTFSPLIETLSNFQRTGARPATLRYASY